MKRITLTLFAMLLFLGVGIAQNPPCNQVIIGTGTTTTYELPLNTCYFCSYTQQIYEAEEFGDFPIGSEIISVTFYKSGNCNYFKPNQTIYLGNTTKSTFSGTSDWVPLSELTQVYTGTLHFYDTAFLTIILDIPFIYTGGNLLLAMLNNSGMYLGCGLNNGTFQYHTANNKTLHLKQSDSINPLTPPPATGIHAGRNNIIFNQCDEIPLPEYTLNPGNILGEGAAITLVPDPILHGENGTAYFTTTRNCFYITDVIIGGVHYGAIESFEFINVTAPLPVIEIVTSVNEYEVTLTHFLDGIITGSGGGIYYCGTEVAIKFPAMECCEIEKVLIDGVENPEAALSGGYALQVTANHIIEVFYQTIVSINEPALESISIYSIANVVYIVKDTHHPIQEVSIFDIYGRVVWQGTPQEQIVLYVANGIYAVRLTTDDTFITTKISIQR